MIEVFSEPIFSNTGMDVANDKVAGRSNADFVCHVTRQDELSISPTELELCRKSIRPSS